MINITLSSKGLSETENQISEILKKAIPKYNLLVCTKEILIEEGSVPHAFPVLTINTLDIDNEPKIVEKYIHEQLHWFATSNLEYDNCISYLQDKYTDLGDCNKSGTYPNSFWEHLIVCWNTRNILWSIYDSVIITELYSWWQAYPLTEKLVEDKYDELEIELKKFNMIYNTKTI